MNQYMDAVIFDMDGVIFDSERLVLVCWEKVSEKYGIQGIEEVFMPCIGTNAEKTKEVVLDHYGQDFPFEEFRKEASVLFHEDVNRNGLPVKKGVRELLEYLKEREIPTAVASSTRLEVVTGELKQAGLYEYFKAVMGGDQLKRSKPEPDIYLMTCEKLGVNPGQAYAIEDSYNGIRSSYSAGMKPIMVPDMLPATEEMLQKSIVVLDDLLLVKDYLEEIHRRGSFT
ncbi:MAG: HAD family phosphatase [Lachnospiraceae bacterium]|jgi:HAD superfamily hydrolase (TIGR01509 family)|nr:HAD family phosphatase [Lachnospiraceae bacterium]